MTQIYLDTQSFIIYIYIHLYRSNHICISNHICNSGTQICSIKHIVADAFCSKQSLSALLVHEEQASKSVAYQDAIQLLVVTTSEIYMRTQAVCAKSVNVER